MKRKKTVMVPIMTPTTEVLFDWFAFEKTPTIRYLVTPIHNNEGELVRSRMTRKLDDAAVIQEVRRAINAWLYESEGSHSQHSQSEVPTHNFGEIVSRIILAVYLGQASLRGYFGSPESFNRMEGPTRWAIEAAYRALWAVG